MLFIQTIHSWPGGTMSLELWSAQLNSADAELRGQAVENLSLLDTSKVIPLLIQALNDPDDGVGLTAALALAERGGQQALDALFHALDHPDPEIRVAATEAMGLHQQVRALEKLCVLLSEDEDELVRTAAAESLGEIQQNQAAEPLRLALLDPSPLVRGYAALALSTFKTSQDRAVLERALVREKDPLALIRFHAALLFLGVEAHLNDLIKALEDEDYRVRCATAHLLASLVTPATTDLITSRLDRALEQEQTPAGRSAISNALEELV